MNYIRGFPFKFHRRSWCLSQISAAIATAIALRQCTFDAHSSYWPLSMYINRQSFVPFRTKGKAEYISFKAHPGKPAFCYLKCGENVSWKCHNKSLSLSQTHGWFEWAKNYINRGAFISKISSLWTACPCIFWREKRHKKKTLHNSNYIINLSSDLCVYKVTYEHKTRNKTPRFKNEWA